MPLVSRHLAVYCCEVLVTRTPALALIVCNSQTCCGVTSMPHLLCSAPAGPMGIVALHIMARRSMIHL